MARVSATANEGLSCSRRSISSRPMRTSSVSRIARAAAERGVPVSSASSPIESPRPSWRSTTGGAGDSRTTSRRPEEIT